MARSAARQHGMVTGRQLYDLGLTDRQVQADVDAGVLVQVHRGTFRHAAGEDTWRTQLTAACLACGPTAVASARSAGRLWGLRDVPRWRPEVTVLDTTKPRLRGVVVHRTDRLDAVDVSRVDGISVTSPARTLLDLGALLPRPVLTPVLEDATFRRLLVIEDVLSILERLGGPGRRGTAALRGAVDDAVVTGRLESRLELALARLLEIAGGPPPVRQYDVALAGGVRARLDFAWPDRRLAVEADGRRWHSTKRDFDRNLVRSRALEASGWRVYPFGWTDVHHHRAATLAELRRLITVELRAA